MNFAQSNSLNRCSACRRKLTNKISIRQGIGPDCLKRAVQAGTAPLEALEEFTAWKKAQPKRKAVEQGKPVCSNTPDLFESLRDQAIQLLNAAAEDCRAVGLTVTIEIRS